MAHTSEAGPASRTTSLVTALRVTATLTVVVLAWQFVTAGSLVKPSGASPALDLHQAGAIVLHVVSGLTMIAAALLWRAGAALWPTVVSALVFVLSFVQAYLGDGETLYLHVPGALVLTIGAVLVAGWAFSHGVVDRRS